MAKICNNTKIRIPTVNIAIKSPPTGMPNIDPYHPSSAEMTSDGFMIEGSTYLLTFILDSTVGYFEDFSAQFSAASGYDPDLVFKPSNIVTVAPSAGKYNYMTYYVLNAATANGQAPGQSEQFNYSVTYVVYDQTTPLGTAKEKLMNGKRYFVNNNGSITNGAL